MSSDGEALRELVALNAVQGIGSVLHRRLLTRFGSNRAILRATEKDLREVRGIGPVIARELRAASDGKRADAELELAAKSGISILTAESPAFPRSLTTIYDAPMLLYARGALLPGDDLAIAVVGSRRSTPYGQAQADKLSSALAARGVCVVSGLARGIDTCAHEGALRAKGRTVAVLGSGLLNIYPPENGRLSHRIAESGAVLSEFPLSSPPDARHFPRRNRIVSGLSLGVLVVEAPTRSGALITVDWALDQGREIFAVPGRIDGESSRGCHAILRQGAKLVETVEDILEELGPHRARLVPATGVAGAGLSAGAAAPKPELDEKEEILFGLLGSEPIDIDSLTTDSSLPPSSVSATLLLLEMKGLAKQLPGKLFVRAS
ncbi:MAG: DNA-protecting protein DprA [Planctomycetes bacterium]|nr:DNA-protecting protein DprA [Planctomycetota bacterium]